jgi:hypothetical protein
VTTTVTDQLGNTAVGTHDGAGLFASFSPISCQLYVEVNRSETLDESAVKEIVECLAPRLVPAGWLYFSTYVIANGPWVTM